MSMPGNFGESYRLRKMTGARWTVASGTPSFSSASRAPTARLDPTMTASPGRWSQKNSVTASYTGLADRRMPNSATSLNPFTGCHRSVFRAVS